MTKVYAVVEIAWEYNDEVYTTSNYGNDNILPPPVAYRSRQRAQQVAICKTVEFLEELDCLGSYSYDINDLVRDTDEFERLVRTVVPQFSADDDSIASLDFGKTFKKLSLENQARMVDQIDIVFFKVIEVEIED